MRIAVIADSHANVIALEKVLSEIKTKGYDMVYHLGDSINLGPFPKETVEMLLDFPNMNFILGDHDMRYLNDLEGFIPKVEGAVEHYNWSHSMLTPMLKDRINQWPFVQHKQFNNLNISFVHYGLNEEENDFLPIVYEPKIENLDSYFDKYKSDLVFYGHTHKIQNAFGHKHYLNPGAVGVNNKAHIPYLLLDIQDDGTYQVTQYQIPYNIEPVLKAFHDRNVPNREQIINIFYQ